jgi:hypothetical protein
MSALGFMKFRQWLTSSPAVQAASTTSTETGSPSVPSSSRESMTRRVLPRPSGIVSPGRVGAAMRTVGGSAGVPSSRFAGVQVSITPAMPLEPGEWDRHLPILRRKHPAWLFAPGYHQH